MRNLNICFKCLGLLVFLVAASPTLHAAPTPPPWGANYQQVFYQDFTSMTSDAQIKVNGGYTLNSGSVWISHYSNGLDDSDFINPIGHDLPFGIDGTGSGANYLTIRAQPDASNANNNWSGTYTTGTLSSMDVSGNGFSQKYGYFEASIWVPNTPGATNNDDPNTHPAFWLLSHGPGAGGGSCEIDATESYGNWGTGPNQNPAGNPNFSSMTWHDWFASTSKYGQSYVNEPNMSTGFHLYGVDVEPTSIMWYYDRQQVWSAPSYPDAQVPLGVLLDLGLGGGNYNNSDNTGYNWNLTGNPSDMKVQYVAVWASPSSPNFQVIDSSPTLPRWALALMGVLMIAVVLLFLRKPVLKNQPSL